MANGRLAMTVIKDSPGAEIDIAKTGLLLISGAEQGVEAALPRPNDQEGKKPRRPSPPGSDTSCNVCTANPNLPGALAATVAPPRSLGLLSASHRAPPTQNGPLSERRALRVNEFCNLYALSRATTYKLIKSGQLRTVVVGGRRLVPVDAAEALISE
jgi:excisionase family DNA binding protein